MHDPRTVETILARLMPTALSEDAQRGMEGMLDELALADGGAVHPDAAGGSRFRRWFWGGLAATGMGAAILFHSPDDVPPIAGQDETSAPEFVLVGESDRIESMTDEGWQEDADGSAMRAVRLRVVEENSLYDQETGIVMKVSEPRDEVFLMPISAF